MTREGAWSAFVEDYDITVPDERVEEELRVMLMALSHQMQYAVFTTGRDARLPTPEEQEAQREELRDEAYLAVKEELVLAELLARQALPIQDQPKFLEVPDALFGEARVSSIGGLADSIIDWDTPGGGCGFTFQSYNADDMLGAVRRAMGLYYSDYRSEMVPRALKCDFSWRRSAKQYMAMYLGI